MAKVTKVKDAATAEVMMEKVKDAAAKVAARVNAKTDSLPCVPLLSYSTGTQGTS